MAIVQGRRPVPMVAALSPMDVSLQTTAWANASVIQASARSPARPKVADLTENVERMDSVLRRMWNVARITSARVARSAKTIAVERVSGALAMIESIAWAIGFA